MKRLFWRTSVLDGGRQWPNRCALLATGLGLVVCGPAAVAVGAPPAVVRTTEILPGLTSVLRADGSLELTAEPAEPVLSLQFEDPDAALVRLRTRVGAGRDLASRVSRVVEGCHGGLRGPGERADDDGDGLCDEDPLDGRDNDGDGLVDEDFAAISDAMIAITRPEAVGGGHLEYYSWAHARLKSTIFASARGGAGSRLVLVTAGSDWASTPIALQQHSVTGRVIARDVVAMVSRVGGSGGCDGARRWLGVVVLDPAPRGRTGTARIEGRQLTVTTGGEPVAIAVCAADSWLQLSRMLVDAQRTRDGVADPVTGAATPWVVAPRCPTCRAGVAPEFLWRIDRWGGLVLTAVIGEGVAGPPDPDLFRIGAVGLGAPARISWRPADGENHDVAWSCADAVPGAPFPGDPYAALPGVRAHGAQGRLEFHFDEPPSALLRILDTGESGYTEARRLDGVTLDGRSLVAKLGTDVVVDGALQSAVALARGGPAPADPTAEADPERLREGRSRPNLAPELLKGWPNPFTDAITLRFEIPQTVGEAFTWNSSEDRPADLDLTAPVPWKNGIPEASVKIYTMSGQHLVTLHSGQVASGAVAVQWNATDNFGRRVASGSYICKLQLDDWSVTRRLTFVR